MIPVFRGRAIAWKRFSETKDHTSVVRGGGVRLAVRTGRKKDLWRRQRGPSFYCTFQNLIPLGVREVKRERVGQACLSNSGIEIVCLSAECHDPTSLPREHARETTDGLIDLLAGHRLAILSLVQALPVDRIC